MRKVEGLIVLLLVIAIPTAAILPEYPLWLKISIIAIALLVPLHAWIEGLHWQMIPAYAAALLMPAVLTRVSTSGIAKLTVLAVAGLFVLLSIACSWVLPMFKLPKPTGKYPVGTRMLYCTDPNRVEMHAGAWPGNREAVVQLWYPAAFAKGPRAMYRKRKETTLRSSYQAVLPTNSLQDVPMASGRFPVILHNPAWHGYRHRGTFMTQELASHGFIVAAISHPYNSSLVELSDGRVAHPDYGLDLGFSLHHYIPLPERLKLANDELAIQTEDCRFVLNELERLDQTPGHPLESRLLRNCVGTYGHSFGGAVSAELAKEDDRVCSALELDGVLHGAAAEHGLEKPLMLIDSPWMVSPDEHEGDPQLAETSRLWKIIAETKVSVLARCGGFRIIIEGIGHTSFSDVGFMSPLRLFSKAGVVPQKRLAEILNAYTVAFFKETLLDEDSGLLSGASPNFPEAKLEIWPAPVTAQLSYIGQEPE